MVSTRIPIELASQMWPIIWTARLSKQTWGQDGKKGTVFFVFWIQNLFATRFRVFLPGIFERVTAG